MTDGGAVDVTVMELGDQLILLDRDDRHTDVSRRIRASLMEEMLTMQRPLASIERVKTW